MGLVLFLFFISCVFTLFLVSYDIQRACWKCSGISQQLSLTHWIAPSVLCCWGWTLTPTYISNCYESDVASLFCTLNISSVKLWYIPFSTEQSCQWWFGFVFFTVGVWNALSTPHGAKETCVLLWICSTRVMRVLYPGWVFVDSFYSSFCVLRSPRALGRRFQTDVMWSGLCNPNIA